MEIQDAKYNAGLLNLRRAFAASRKKRKYSLRYVSDVSGLCVQTLVRLENPERFPAHGIMLHTIYILAEVYGLKVNLTLEEVDRRQELG